MSVSVAKHVLMEVCSMDKATCIGCGCDDDHACAAGCFWLRVDYQIGQGVCSECPSSVADWDRGNRALSGVAAKRQRS